MDADTFFFIVVFAHAARLVVPLTSASEPLLDAELQRCEGVFQCGCRGVGTDWKANTCRKLPATPGQRHNSKRLEMREKGFYGEATKYLGRATKIAAQSGNEEKMRRLKKVVEVINAKEGTVQLKKFIAKADEMDLISAQLAPSKTSAKDWIHRDELICPKNSRHQSTDPAYCSECGAKIDVGNAPAKDADTTNIIWRRGGAHQRA